MKTSREWVWTFACLLVALGLTTPASAKSRGHPVVLSGVVNLNQASLEELDLLPGIGPKAAQRILDYRAKRPFARPEELVRVKGFGKKRFDVLKAHLAVAGATTLKVQRGTPTQARAAPHARR
jgi:competence protein ComEA